MPSRRERKAIETRQAILRSARALFEQVGFEEATIERIAEDADIAPRTFFRYFPTKEALLFVELDAAREAVFKALDDRPADEDVLESLVVVLHHFASEIDRRWDEFAWVREITDAYRLDRSQERVIASQDIHLRVAEMLARRMGVDARVDPRPAAWAKAIMAAFGQAVLLGPESSPTGRTFDLFIDVLDSTVDALGRLSAIARKVP